MAYRFVSFAGVDLPLYNRQTDQTGGTAQSTLVRTINGAMDRKGSKREVPAWATWGMRAILAEGSTIVGESDDWVTGGGDRMVTGGGDVLVFALGASVTSATLREQLDALRALIGKPGTLVRSPLEDAGETQSVTARLLTVREVTSNEQRGYLPVELAFEAVNPYWHGTSRTANRSGGTIGATNGGNAPVRDAILTVTGAVASSVTVTGTGINWTWTGVLSGGQTLVIAGNTVTANGAPSAVTINSGHTRDVLIELEPGSTTLTVTGGASASLAWYDAWQ